MLGVRGDSLWGRERIVARGFFAGGDLRESRGAEIFCGAVIHGGLISRFMYESYHTWMAVFEVYV